MAKSKFEKSINKNIILLIVFGVISIACSVGIYYLAYKAVNNYIDKKIELATQTKNVESESNVHDIITVSEAYTKNLVPYDIIVRSEQTYEDCRVSTSEVSQMTSDIRNHIINVDINDNTFKQSCDYIKGIVNKYNIKVYDIVLKESHTNKPCYFFKYVEQ